MTLDNFRDFCFDVSCDETDANFATREKLAAIAASVSNVALDFGADFGLGRDLFETVSCND
jgi:hypothetical protein